MKDIMRIYIRFAAATAAIALLLVSINIVLLAVWGYYNKSDSINTKENIAFIAHELIKEKNGYTLSTKGQNALTRQYQWAMLLDERGNMIWNDSLPSDVPHTYTLQDVASFSRWYLKDYPVSVWEHPDGLLVLGNPKDSYWKYSIKYPMKVLNTLPQWLTRAACLNIVFALTLSLLLGLWLIRSLKPFVKGIEDLAEKKEVQLATAGLLGNLASSINKTSSELHSQRMVLQKRDAARANWISGVSHDIRTPLSMVLGYASEIESNPSLPDEVRNQSSIIRNQSLKIKQLVNDLNLASKLEYEMQPLKCKPTYVAALIRQVAADFLNDQTDAKYELDFSSDKTLEFCQIFADEALIKRAVSNLIQNSITHNPNGCTIVISLKREIEECILTISDNGKGVSKEKLQQLISKPHYMASDDSTREQRHGLGLLIVQQIIKAHHGSASFSSTENSHFTVVLRLPCTLIET